MFILKKVSPAANRIAVLPVTVADLFSHRCIPMANPRTSLPLCRSSVIVVHEIVKPYVHYTPVLTNSTITVIASTPQSVGDLEGTEWENRTPTRPKLRIWLKCENLQLVGAFKVRGAFYALQRLMAEKDWVSGRGKERGVITHSSGKSSR
jgi:threonine dehydratase